MARVEEERLEEAVERLKGSSREAEESSNVVQAQYEWCCE